MIARILTALRAGYEAATTNYHGEPVAEPAARILRQDEVELAPLPADVNLTVRAELARVARLIDENADTSAASAAIVRVRISELLPATARRRP